jgi:hypothetical protein
MDALRKRSRAEREQLQCKIDELLVDMLDAKQIAATLNINVGYAYQRMKDLGYRRCFVTAEEREQIRRQRVDRRAAKLVL